jgi:hypothetical protein
VTTRIQLTFWWNSTLVKVRRCNSSPQCDHLANQTLDNQCLIPNIRHAEHLPLQLNIRKLGAFAKKHMDDCTKRHPICSSTIPKVRPTRIIDVGLDATLQNIFLTRLKDDRAQYVTLSHCCKFIGIPGLLFALTAPESHLTPEETLE